MAVELPVVEALGRRCLADTTAKAGTLRARCDRSADVRSYPGGLRAAHRPERAPREEVDRARLP